MRPRFSALVLFFFVGIAGAADEYGLMARGERAFPPLVADPRELQIALKAVSPINHEIQGEVALGEYFSLYKWRVNDSMFLQWLAGGGVFSRFNLLKPTKDLKVSDYSANMPVELRVNRQWSFRVMPFHVSSHLGDDFIAETGRMPRKYSVDSLKVLGAYEPTPRWRFYSGYQFIIRSVTENLGRSVLQAGTEWNSAWWGPGPRWQAFAAQDFQTWERIGWNPQYHVQAGIRLKREPTSPQSISWFVEFGAGRRPYGQFYKEKETRWSTGLRFGLW